MCSSASTASQETRLSPGRVIAKYSRSMLLVQRGSSGTSVETTLFRTPCTASISASGAVPGSHSRTCTALACPRLLRSGSTRAHSVSLRDKTGQNSLIQALTSTEPAVVVRGVVDILHIGVDRVVRRDRRPPPLRSGQVPVARAQVVAGRQRGVVDVVDVGHAVV